MLSSQYLCEGISAADLELTTPCARWNLADLLRHMISQNKRFAAAARGEDPDEASTLQGSPLSTDPAAEYWTPARQHIPRRSPGRRLLPVRIPRPPRSAHPVPEWSSALSRESGIAGR